MSAVEEPVVAALREASVWRLLGLLAERPRPGWAEDLRAVALALERADTGADRTVDFLVGLARRAADEANEGRYFALVGPGGPASPREAANRGRDDPARTLARLRALYGAFAFAPDAEDPLDHVAVEAGFVGYLHLKEGYAWAAGDEAAAQTTIAARGRFLTEHLGPFAWRFARRLTVAGDTWLAAAAWLLAERTHAPPPPEDHVLDPSEEIDLPAACGACPAFDDSLPG